MNIKDINRYDKFVNKEYEIIYAFGKGEYFIIICNIIKNSKFIKQLTFDIFDKIRELHIKISKGFNKKNNEKFKEYIEQYILINN